MSAQTAIGKLNEVKALLDPYKSMGGEQLEEVLKNIDKVIEKLTSPTKENVGEAKKTVTEMSDMFEGYRSYVPDVADKILEAKAELEKL